MEVAWEIKRKIYEYYGDELATNKQNESIKISEHLKIMSRHSMCHRGYGFLQWGDKLNR